MATALSRAMKKAASSSSVIIPLATKFTCPRRNCTSAILTTPLNTGTTNLFQRTSNPSHHNFSALAEERPDTVDDSLLSVIQYEIDCAEGKFIPKFPFKIEDNGKEEEYQRRITLTREYQGEDIEVDVHYRAPVGEEEKQWVLLDVSVSKKNGLSLEFYVHAYVDEIKIVSLDVKNQNASDEKIPSLDSPRFSELDEKLQKDFYIYLKDRGIEPSITGLLLDYMAKRKQKKYSGWLKNLKKFVAN